MSDELPRQLQERIRAYLEDVAPPGEVDDLEARIHARLGGRVTWQPAQVLAIAHEMVTSRIRITPDTAATALVDHGGLSPVVAAQVVGLPVDQVAVGEVDPPEPSGERAEPVEPTEPTEPDEADGPEDAIIDGWADFWTPPATPEVPGAEDAGAEDAADPADTGGRPGAGRVPPGGFQTWTGGATGQTRGTRAPLVAVAVGLGVVALAVVGLLSVGDGGEQVAVGEPTGVTTNDEAADGATVADGAVDTAPDSDADTDADGDTAGDAGPDGDTGTTGPEAGGEVTVEGAEIAAEDGGSVRTGDTALVSLTVAGTEDQPATLQWELRRDGEAIFPSAPLVVPADGDVRLAIPPALLADAGEYLVRVTHDGATLFERDFTVSAG